MPGSSHGAGYCCENGSLNDAGSRTYGGSEHGTGNGVMHRSKHSAGDCCEHGSLNGTGSRT